LSGWAAQLLPANQASPYPWAGTKSISLLPFKSLKMK
jgi:hypothetical protein